MRSLSAPDINQNYLSWINNTEVTKNVEAGQFPTTIEELEMFYKTIKKSKTDVMFAIIDKEKDYHIGNIKLGGINWIHRFADLGIMIGDKGYWGKGYGTESCHLLLEYAFNRLNLNKVILGFYATHTTAIKTYRKVGFKVEGRIKKMLSFEGKYVDKVLMGILRSEYKKCS